MDSALRKPGRRFATLSAMALKKYPGLRFTRIQVLTGVSSGTLTYRSVNDLSAAEVMRLSGAGRVIRVDAHDAR